MVRRVRISRERSASLITSTRLPIFSKRGHHIPEPDGLPVVDIDTMWFQNQTWPSSRDHSKWGVDDGDRFMVGDLNRMTSQYTRGGGGFVVRDATTARALRSLLT